MQPASEFQLILQTIEAAQKPFATQQELNALGQLFDEVFSPEERITSVGVSWMILHARVLQPKALLCCY